MRKKLANSELIISPQGRVYHLNLHPEMIGEEVIVVGDPERVAKISRHFDKIEHQVTNRELITHTGYIGNKRISVISSGMGTDNVELLLTELDALVNIDFAKRKVKRKLRSLNIYRIGTSGCIQPDIPLDALLVSTAALGLDTLMAFYDHRPEAQLDQFCNKVQRLVGLPFKPYMAKASVKLLAKFSDHMVQGVTITSPGFYAPQGRQLRLPLTIEDLPGRFATLESPFGRFTNFEMETAGYYALAEMLGHQMVSLNALIANRATGAFSTNHERAVEQLIQLTLAKIA